MGPEKVHAGSLPELMIPGPHVDEKNAFELSRDCSEKPCSRVGTFCLMKFNILSLQSRCQRSRREQERMLSCRYSGSALCHTRC